MSDDVEDVVEEEEVEEEVVEEEEEAVEEEVEVSSSDSGIPAPVIEPIVTEPVIHPPVNTEYKSIGVAPEFFSQPGQGEPAKLTALNYGKSSRFIRSSSSSSFESFVVSKGINKWERRTSEAWDLLAEEYNNKPVYGVRRNENNGSHQPHPSKLG